MTYLPNIASRIYGRPLLLHPSTAALISENLGERFGAAASSDLAALLPEASRFRGEPTRNGGRYTVAAGRAIVPVMGELCNRGAWIGASSGLTSYEGITEQMRLALGDPTVSGIVLDVNSPGGEAVGLFECADVIRAADAKKPVTAFVNGMAASAAYALASAAGRIVVTRSSIVGSIGVVMIHLDQSRKLEKQGVTPTLIFMGDHKVDGHPFGPLPDAVKADITAELGKFYGMFVGTVARFRGMKADAVKATQARCFMGADAVAAGLADKVGTLDDALSRPTPKSGDVPCYPVGAAAPRPAPGASYTAPAPAAKSRTAAEVRALQVEACSQVWRNGGRKTAASMGFPVDVMDQVSRTMQAPIGAAWDETVAAVRHRYGG